MTCPRCSADFSRGSGVCPECGVHLVHSVSGVVKTSAVMIAAAGEKGFYRSVQDVPEPLRTQLLETTTSANSGTIVIADRAGKEQITQVVGRRESARERAAAAASAGTSHSGRRHVLGLSWIVWAGFVLAVAAAGLIWFVFAIH